jgi:hypothetical protein
MWRPWQARREACEALGAFCQDLELVLRTRFHDSEYLADERLRHICVKQVTHRVHEDSAGRPPTSGQIQGLRPKREFETIRVRLWKALGHAPGVAVVAAR